MNARRRTLVIVALAGIALAAIISVTYEVDLNKSGSASLPAGCVRPAGGFLIIASNTGYNDSIDHGAPAKPWPILTVHQGQNVSIVVCNIDEQAHGFQVNHYFDKSIETIVPGQVLRVSFIADETGNFDIYCSILCTIHIYMQSGLLQVIH